MPPASSSDLATTFDHILEETVNIMDRSGIRYAFIGGVASGTLGRPRSTRDIDLFVTPDAAEKALLAFQQNGFRTEKTNPDWRYKASKDLIFVHIIFRSKGEIYLDSEMAEHSRTAEFHGRKIRLVAPEDLLIIKAVAHSELMPSHWDDAIALLAYSDMDWNYLIRRARRAPRRVLSILLYAQSIDIGVPNWAIRSLYDAIFARGTSA
ncbi:MAG: hypothetical protein A2X94_02910 [Bdellovibrionales bacterium GWB1_55_8]|nr:MAG: hypothetical protein A2X94_02910 [Bdellovibrionales bacterium GWB1_55_8]